MTTFDIFNGDADGICSLLQLRLDSPRDAVLVSGVKRKVDLLNTLSTEHTVRQGDKVTVLDISMLKNQPGLESALTQGAQVFYADHHQSGDIPTHPNLTARINLSPDTCTGLIINKHLESRHLLWALTAAFGDNLIDKANALGSEQGISRDTLALLEKLGTYINYNGYGASLEDLFYDPAALFTILLPYASPIDFIEDGHDAFTTLEEGYQSDFIRANSADIIHKTAQTSAYLLPDERWARRVSGVFGNDLANQTPNSAHAVLTEQTKNGQKGYLVSIRAPLTNKRHADTLASKFPSGGGRKAAAGINFLPEAQLSTFLQDFQSQYQNA